MLVIITQNIITAQHEGIIAASPPEGTSKKHWGHRGCTKSTAGYVRTVCILICDNLTI